MGHGIPGDYTSPSRFVKAAWLRKYARGEGEATLFSLLGAIAPPRGAVMGEDGSEHYTRYSCVMSPTDLCYAYKSAESCEILRTYMKKESLDGETLI
jgi:choloylglycine hydrolase